MRFILRLYTHSVTFQLYCSFLAKLPPYPYQYWTIKCIIEELISAVNKANRKRVERKNRMDTSTVVSIAISLFSVAISIFLGVTAFYISNKSDKTLASIQTEINALRSDFIKLFHQAQTNYYEVTKMVVEAKVYKGEWSSEKADDFQEELNEALQEMRQLNFNPASVLSKQSKVGEKEEHG